jgi:DNA-binding SARP family transcriptional activator
VPGTVIHLVGGSVDCNVIEFRILGPFAVIADGRPVAIPGAKERATLALLLLRVGQIVSVDSLIDALWDDQPPATARNSLQVRIAGLRKLIGAERIESRGSGYVLHADQNEVDLERFELLVARGGGENLREALALWRGPALADFDHEAWAQAPIARLQELRLTAFEQRVDFELHAGRHAELVAELETEMSHNPLRERLRAQLMLALYRSGRQADALRAYQDGRKALLEQLGIEPYPAMRELERAILRQEPSLDLDQPTPPERSILVAALEPAGVDGLLDVAESLARRPRRELILTLAVAVDVDLAAASARLHQRRDELAARGFASRAAAFTSDATGRDVARVAQEQDVDLVLIGGSRTPLDDEGIADLLRLALCDVAVVRAGTAGPGPVLVPFTGAEHDWSAVEIGAWLARALDLPLRLAGPAELERDSSRLLASASLAVQRALGVAVEPLLVEPAAASLVGAANDAGIVVAGLSERWAQEGLGPVRSALVAEATPPVVLVRRGLRPGGLAPPQGHTRFTWSRV